VAGDLFEACQFDWSHEIVIIDGVRGGDGEGCSHAACLLRRNCLANRRLERCRHAGQDYR
jgi:hypothetical protein